MSDLHCESSAPVIGSDECRPLTRDQRVDAVAGSTRGAVRVRWRRPGRGFRRQIVHVVRNLSDMDSQSGRLSGRYPVVLLPGFCAPRRSLVALERRIVRKLGRTALRFRLANGPLLPVVDVRRSAERAELLLDCLDQEFGIDSVDVVGHSLGGLVAAYWLKQIDRGRRIRRVVTLGTPHRGTRFAWHGALLLGWVSRAPWQMIPGSSLLRELEMGPVPCGSELIAIASRHDSIVPRESARGMDAPRQRSIEISRAGHLDYLWSSDAFLSIAAALASPLPE